MKRVLILTCYYHPHVGGIEYTSRVMADIFTKNGMECQVLCFNEDAAEGDFVCKRGETVHEDVNGIAVTRCGSFTKVASQSLSWTYPRELRRMMDEFRPEIVVFHYPNPYLTHFLLHYKDRGFKLVVYYNLDITKQKLLGKLFNAQTIALLKRADVIVATSPLYIEGSPFLSRFRDKCTVISCCVDPGKLRVTPHVKALAEDIRERYKGKTICFAVGRHVPYKGLKYLVEAGKHLDDTFQILIGGQGPLTESLRQEAAGDGKIRFLGRVSDEELTAYYLACDIFCFPSITKNEAFGIVMAEAMYFEKPCVTFTIPGSGVNYVNLNGVTGIECPNRDVEAYAQALKTLGADGELRKKYGQAGKKRVEENFTLSEFESRLMKRVLELDQVGVSGK